MSQELGVLPSVFIWGDDALSNRHLWHISFDMEIMTRWWAHVEKLRKKAEKEAEAKHNARANSRRVKHG